MDRAGFEPAASTLRMCAKTYGSGDSLCSDGIHCGESEAINWEAFEQWIRKEFRPKTAYNRLLYAKPYSHCLLNKDLKPLLELSQDKRAHVMNALSALSKFLGIHEDFLKLVKNYGLKWTVRSDDIIIARFTKSVDPDDVFNWIKQVKQARPELKDFMDFIATTGLRYAEGVESYNLIIKLAKEGKLKEYYDSEREILEHYKFKEIFLRRTKKAFISFVPKYLIQNISDNKLLNKYSVQTKVKRKTHAVRFGDIRELHGSLLAKYLSEIEINFLHGRISTTVFMRNYFNPALISDLKERMFKGIDEIRIKTF